MPNLVEIGSVFQAMNEKLKTLDQRTTNDDVQKQIVTGKKNSTCNINACIKWFLILQIFLC